MKCAVCGRTIEELEEEFGNDAEITEHQGINKCSKCIREYEVETGDGNSESSDERSQDLNWKDKVTT
jgi:DNA-directed RNA polymerase subunit RPC12/RpoP